MLEGALRLTFVWKNEPSETDRVGILGREKSRRWRRSESVEAGLG